MDTAKQRTDSTTLRGNKGDSHFLSLIYTKKVVIKETPMRLHLSSGDFWTLDSEKRRRLLKLGC